VSETSDAAELPRLQEVVTKMFVYADRRDWTGLRSVLADRVHVDYTSLNGGEPATMPADELVAAWNGALSVFQATQHLVGNFLIESLTDDAATVTCYAQATHFRPNDVAGSLWTLGAHYRFELERAVGWRIAGVTMTTVWGDGNQHLTVRAER
jgi:SnoaL-like domain